MMAPSLGVLLGLGGLLIALAVGGGLFALRLQKRQQRLADRIELVTASYGRADAPEETYRSSRRQVEKQPPLHAIGKLFGYDPLRKAEYKGRWWIVIPVSFVLARLIAALMTPLVGWIAMAMIPLGALMISRAFYNWCRAQRKRDLYLQFPDALAMIVRGVRVGIPVTESMRTVATESADPTADEFRRVADRTGLGVPLEEALYEMGDRTGLSEYRFFATAIGLQAQTGGGLSETLDNLADVIRKRVALRARGYALASEARTSIIILCALPVVTGVALSILNPAYIAQLFETEMGRKIFGAAVLSFSTGLGIMQIIVKKSLA